MCDRFPLMLDTYRLSHKKSTVGGLKKFYCATCCKGVLHFNATEPASGKDQLICCPGHYFPDSLGRLISSHTYKEDTPGLMKELEQVSQESPDRPSTSGLEHLEPPKKAASDPGAREKFRNIDAICASLAASSSANKSKSVFNDRDQPWSTSPHISVDSQNGSKERVTHRGSFLSHSSFHRRSSSMSPTHQDHDMECLVDHQEGCNSLPTFGEKKRKLTLQGNESPCSMTIQDVRSLSGAKVRRGSPSISGIYEEQDSSGATEECASACSSTTYIEPGSTGSSTLINSPSGSIDQPESPVAIEECTKQGTEICPNLALKSDKELCLEHGIQECYIQTRLITLPSDQTHFLKSWSLKYLNLSRKEVRTNRVPKSDKELCQEHGIQECNVPIRFLTLPTKQTCAPFTIHYTRNYIAHVIRVGYNEQLHKKKVNWAKVYDKYLAGRNVSLRRDYFKKIAQKSLTDYLRTQEIYEARERRARLIFQKETENLLKKSKEKEARERRARLIRLKETEMLRKKRVYYTHNKYVLADSGEAKLFGEAVQFAKRLKISCRNIAR